MRLIALIIAIKVIILNMAYAQDYKTFNPNRTAYYTDPCQNIRCVRIDSVKYIYDSIYYPFTVMQEAAPGCFSPWIASWIGPRIIIRANGMNVFFNRNNDTIAIKTKAKLNEKWITYYFKDSAYIEATLVRHDTLNFLGLTDSVKTISFQAYDKAGNHLEQDVNNMTVQISQNYGLVKTLNFYLFPGIEVYYPPEQLLEYKLTGLSNPETGVQNITWLDVHDFQPGDELHILYKSSLWCEPGYSLTEKTIFKYIERTDYEDSIAYSYSILQSVYKAWQDSTRLSFYEGTMKEVIQDDADFDKLPGEPIVNDFESYCYTSTPDSKTNTRGYDIFWFNGDSCWFKPLIDGCLNNETYLKGLGGPYYSGIGTERNLVYYKKGDTEWGVPLVITKVSNYENEGKILVSPNPAHGIVKISLDKSSSRQLNFTLFNVFGTIVLEESLEYPEKIINIETLNPGVYLFRINEYDRLVYSGKLILQ